MSPELRDAALRLLARREHSRYQLAQKLRLRGFAPDDIERLIDDLAEQGLQSDRRFAEAFANGRVARGDGPRKIQAMLGQRGVRGALADDVIAEIDADRWIEAGHEALRRRQGRADDKAALQAYLIRRGFESGQCAAILATDE